MGGWKLSETELMRKHEQTHHAETKKLVQEYQKLAHEWEAAHDKLAEELAEAREEISQLQADKDELYTAAVKDNEEAQSALAAARKEITLLTRKIITCGVAASHPDVNLSRTGAYAGAWDSPQAEEVRKLREEIEQLKADAKTVGETAYFWCQRAEAAEEENGQLRLEVESQIALREIAEAAYEKLKRDWAEDDKDVTYWEDRAEASEAARADTLAENEKLNNALGKIHVICSDAGIDPGNVVDRVRTLSDQWTAMKDDCEVVRGENAAWENRALLSEAKYLELTIKYNNAADKVLELSDENEQLKEDLGHYRHTGDCYCPFCGESCAPENTMTRSEMSARVHELEAENAALRKVVEAAREVVPWMGNYDPPDWYYGYLEKALRDLEGSK